MTYEEQQQLAKQNQEIFKNKIKEINKQYWVDLTEEEKQKIMQSICKNNIYHKHKNTIPNQKFAELLDYYGIKYEQEYCLDTKCFDFKIDNILVEINPTITHNIDLNLSENPAGMDKNYHLEKTKLANKYGFRCIHVFDWEDKEKIIKTFFHKSDLNIYARQCEIKEISVDMARSFIDEYHIQNYVSDKVRLGLFYNQELISVMTFGKPRYNKSCEWELIRYCAKENVGGGCQKLFKYFVDNYQPTSIVSYCDKSKFDGGTYEKLNFTEFSKNIPAIHWSNFKTNQHVTNNLLLKQGFDRLFKTDYGKGTSNVQLMLNNGFVRVYDCGQATYIWKK